jgi:hypothetical protein
MRYIDQHSHIKNRADFFAALARGIQSSVDLLKVAPGDQGVTSILGQLETIRSWTNNDREPTKDERWKTRIGLMLTREFDSVTDPRIVDWAELAREVEGYFIHWLDDATYQRVDGDELPIHPMEEDDVTHLRK